jgi:hypothetical protein
MGSKGSNHILQFQSALTPFGWHVLSVTNVYLYLFVETKVMESTEYLLDGLQINIFMLTICDNSQRPDYLQMMSHQH